MFTGTVFTKQAKRLPPLQGDDNRRPPSAPGVPLSELTRAYIYIYIYIYKFKYIITLEYVRIHAIQDDDSGRPPSAPGVPLSESALSDLRPGPFIRNTQHTPTTELSYESTLGPPTELLRSQYERLPIGDRPPPLANPPTAALLSEGKRHEIDSIHVYQLSLYICICLYVYMSIYIYTYIFIYLHIYIYTG